MLSENYEEKSSHFKLCLSNDETTTILLLRIEMNSDKGLNEKRIAVGNLATK